MKKKYNTPIVKLISLYTREILSTSNDYVTSQAELDLGLYYGWSSTGEEDADGIWGN